jgi:hypothetical protein
VLAQAIRDAYRRLASPDPRPAPSFDVARLQPGWARDRLELRCARLAGSDARVAELERADTVRAELLRGRAATLLWTLLAPLLLGLVALLGWLLRDRPELPRSSASVPAEWSFDEGFAVLLRALLAGLVVALGAGLVLQPLGGSWAEVVASAIAALPVFWFFHRRLLAPRVLSFVRVLGLDEFPGPRWRWAALVLALFCAHQLGATLILQLASGAGAQLHWTDTLDELLEFGPATAFAPAALLELVWFPFAAEVILRGLLFLTLRARMGLLPAALWSATMVAAFRNASLPTFLVLVWIGTLQAWVFERSRSILPGVAAAALAMLGTLVAIAAIWR